MQLASRGKPFLFFPFLIFKPLYSVCAVPPPPPPSLRLPCTLTVPVNHESRGPPPPPLVIFCILSQQTEEVQCLRLATELPRTEVNALVHLQ